MDPTVSSTSVQPNTLLQQAQNNPIAFLQSIEQLLESFGPEGVADASTQRFLERFGASLKEIINDSDLPQSIKDAANDIIDAHIGTCACDAEAADAVENSELAETVDCMCDEAAEEVANECACAETEQSEEAATEAEEEAANEGGASAGSETEGSGGASGGGLTPDDLMNDLPGGENRRRKGNWLEVLASTLAKVQSTFLDKALAAADTMAAEADSVSESGEGKSKEFLEAQASYTANMQLFTIFSNQVSTSIKSIGEALAGIARKQ